MKAFTNLEQSKKLAEFLPLESADMHYYYNNGFDKLEAIPTITEEDEHFVLFPEDVPCWSLAALLDILYQVKEIKHQRVTILVGRYAGQQWYVEFVKVQDEKSILLKQSKELVDACYELLLKLNELKLL